MPLYETFEAPVGEVDDFEDTFVGSPELPLDKI